MHRSSVAWVVMIGIGVALGARAAGQDASPNSAVVVGSLAVPPGYVIGAEDVLTVEFWNEKAMSAEATVRPDGKITVPLLNDVHAAGLTPEALGASLAKAALKILREPPNVTVMVKEIRSRKVYVLGEVSRSGVYPLNVEMNVLQVIAAAGGLLEWADKSGIEIMRTENGSEIRLKFNYNEVVRGKNVRQNVLLKPGDLIIVP